MDFLHHAIHKKLNKIDEERIIWTKCKEDQLQAQQNLIDFRNSLQKDILVPIGSKALMPGKLYHTNEIFVGMHSGLFVKCTAHNALDVCQHRLTKSKERLDALDAEYKMYKDRIDLPLAEDAFGNANNAQEIIEEYNEEAELKWREQHKINIREQKKREAEERKCLSDDNSSKNYIEILEQAELMEEFENELDELNVENDEQLEDYLLLNSDRNALQSNESNAQKVTNGINGFDNHANEHQNGKKNDSNESTTSDLSDDIVPAEFLKFSKFVHNLSNTEKLYFYEQKLADIDKYLSKTNLTKIEDLKEFTDKRVVQECLLNAIEELLDENSLNSHGSPSNGDRSNVNILKSPLSPSDGRKRHTRAEFNELEMRYIERSKSELLVFYKSQLRSAMKSIASCSKDAHVTELDEKRELYEYISDRITQLRGEIFKEKQAKLEEKFVDDDTDNDDLAADDGDIAEFDDDECNLITHNDCDEKIDHTIEMVSPSRRISFAIEPCVTTYHLDDEPWRIQNSIETDECVNNLMDQTFQFFNSPSSSSSSSVCGDDGGINDYKHHVTQINSVLQCDDQLPGKKQSNESTRNFSCEFNTVNQTINNPSTIQHKDGGATLLLKFKHSINDSSATVSTDNDTIASPIDIYKRFGGGSSEGINHNPIIANISKEANLDVNALYKKMKQINAYKKPVNNLNGINAIDINNDNSSILINKISNSCVEPKKSILKNKEAVKNEIHAKVYDHVEEEQIFETEDKKDMFIDFDEVLGDVYEKPQKQNQQKNLKTDSLVNKVLPSGNVSLFKRNRMS